MVPTQRRASRSLAALALLFAASCEGFAASPYDSAVLAGRPVMFLRMDTPSAGSQTDLSGYGNNGRYVGGTPATTFLPNGDPAAVFDGVRQYLTVPPSPPLSVPTKGALTIEAWIRPSTLQFPNTENEDFVYFLGKGNPSDGYEYANRMYSLTNSANRPNRISVYHWNPDGGLGSGAYFQDTVNTTQWIFVTDVIDMRTATISIYKNGVRRGTVPLSQYNVTPRTTNAPFNVGTRNYNSWFKGAVAKVAVFDRVLTDAEIARHYAAMSTAAAQEPAPVPAPVPAPGPAPQPPSAPPASAGYLAPQRFLSPALADGTNDAATFGPAAASVEISDLQGRLVYEAQRLSGAIVWKCRDTRGRLVDSGTYVAKIVKDDGGVAYQSFAVVK